MEPTECVSVVTALARLATFIDYRLSIVLAIILEVREFEEPVCGRIEPDTSHQLLHFLVVYRNARVIDKAWVLEAYRIGLYERCAYNY